MYAKVKRTVRESHGDASQKKGKHPLYKVWACMLSRCQSASDKDYDGYGRRGIKVCDEWQDYTKFKTWALSSGYQDRKDKPYKERLSLERNNPDGDYEPGNCSWVTRSENTKNVKAYWKNRALAAEAELARWQ